MNQMLLLKETKRKDMVEDVVLWIAGIAAVAAAAGLIFNGWASYQQSKSTHYRIFKDIEEEYNEIDKRALPLRDYLFTNDKKLMEDYSREKYEPVIQFKRDHVEFHEKLAHLYYQKIIPKSIIEYFKLSYSHALYYIDNARHKEEIKKQVSSLVKWCEEKNIEKKPPYVAPKKEQKETESKEETLTK